MYADNTGVFRLKMNSKSGALLIAGVLLARLATPAFALPDDNQQPINIKANRATQQTLSDGERTEYFGDVVMTQGSLLVNADHLVIHSINRKVTRIKATGRPAKFQQQSSPEQPPVTARAETIDYRLTTEIVVLTNNANITQPDASFSGNRIEYNVGTEEVVAEERVNMIFAPASSEAGKDKNGTASGQ